MKQTKGVIKFNSEPREDSELFKTLDELLVEFRNASPEIQGHTLCLLKDLSKLLTLDSFTTPGTGITIFFKPSDFLLDLCVAVRTGKFDKLIVGNEHCFSLVGSGSVELPILSTLEKLPIGDKE